MKTAGKIVIATALLAGVLAGCKEEAPPPVVVPKAATVKSFTASPSEVKKDESVTLSYVVENATEVAIRTLGGHRRYREAEVKELLGGVIPTQRGAAD